MMDKGMGDIEKKENRSNDKWKTQLHGCMSIDMDMKDHCMVIEMTSYKRCFGGRTRSIVDSFLA
jgi:hypothetical protein